MIPLDPRGEGYPRTAPIPKMKLAFRRFSQPKIKNSLSCHPEGLRSLQAEGSMQLVYASNSPCEVHRSLVAKNAPQDDKTQE